MGSVGVRAARWSAWSLCCLSIALAVTGASLKVGGHPADADLDYDVAFFVVFLVFTAVGAVVAARRPENALGWLLLVQGLLWELAGVVAGYANYALFTRTGAGWPGGTTAAWVLSWLWIPTLGMVPFLFVLFPEGRQRGGPAPFVPWLATVGVVLAVAGRALAPGRMDNTAAIPNPYGLTGAAGALGASEAAGTFLIAVTISPRSSRSACGSAGRAARNGCSSIASRARVRWSSSPSRRATSRRSRVHEPGR
jgi:hypothetical protein